MQRVLLRTGCVEIVDDDLRKKFTARIPLSSDEPIRTGCIDAIKLISQLSGHAASKLNDFFWPLGRSCCNETQLCQIRTCMKNPCSLMNMLTLSSHDECLLEGSCKGINVKFPVIMGAGSENTFLLICRLVSLYLQYLNAI